jgi:uncharacterized membrane protein
MKALIKFVMSIVFKHILPLVIMLIIGGIVAYLSVVSNIPNVPKYQSSHIHFALGLLFDCATQLVGAYFAIIGLTLGRVLLKSGFQVKPVDTI